MAGETKDILGYKTVHESTRSSKSGVSHERWLAVNLNCIPLRQISYSNAGDASAPHNEISVVSINIGEPDPTLFEPPSNFTERSPSQVLEEYTRRFKGAPLIHLPASDDAYLNSQPKE